MPDLLREGSDNTVSDFYDQSIERKKREEKKRQTLLFAAVAIAVVVALFAFLMHESQNQVPPYTPPTTPVPGDKITNNTTTEPVRPTNPPVPTNTSIQVDYNKQITPGQPSNNGVIGGQINGAIYVSPTGNGGANTIVDGAPQIIKDAASNLYQQNTDGSWSKVDWTTKLDSTRHYAVDLNGNGGISLDEQRLYSQVNDIKTNVLPNFHNGVYTLTDSSGSAQIKFTDGTTSVVPISTLHTIPPSQMSNYSLIIGKSGDASTYSTTSDSLLMSATDKSILNYQSSAAYQSSGYNQYWIAERNYINNNGMPAKSADGAISYVTDLPSTLQNYKDTNTAINDVYQQGKLYANNITLNSSQSEAANTYLSTLITKEKLEMTQDILSSQFKSGGTMYNEITALKSENYTGTDPVAKTLVNNYQNSIQTVLPILQNPSAHTAQELATAEAQIKSNYQDIITYQLGHGSTTGFSNVHSYTSFSGVFDALKSNSTELSNINSTLQAAASGVPLQTKNQIDSIAGTLNSAGTFKYLNNSVTVNSFMTDTAANVLLDRANLRMTNNSNIQSIDLSSSRNFINTIRSSNTGYFQPVNTIYPPKVYSPQSGAASVSLSNLNQSQGI